jgi:hypothetical protein
MSLELNVPTLLLIIAILLVFVLLELIKINRRLKNRFPTEKEQDYKWSQEDPMGHWEAHKEEKQTKVSK